MGRRPSACGWGQQYLHALRLLLHFCAFAPTLHTRPGDGTSHTSSFSAFAESRAFAPTLPSRFCTISYTSYFYISYASLIWVYSISPSVTLCLAVSWSSNLSLLAQHVLRFQVTTVLPEVLGVD